MLGNRLLLIAACFFAPLIACASFGHAAAPAESFTIGYSSFSGHYVPLWISVEDRLGKKIRVGSQRRLRGAVATPTVADQRGGALGRGDRNRGFNFPCSWSERSSHHIDLRESG
jgi:hypothetical protein